MESNEGPLCLASLTHIILKFVHISVCTIIHLFVLVTNILLFGGATIFLYLLMDIWDESSLGLLQIKLLRDFVYKSLYTHICFHFSWANI